VICTDFLHGHFREMYAVSWTMSYGPWLTLLLFWAKFHVFDKFTVYLCVVRTQWGILKSRIFNYKNYVLRCLFISHYPKLIVGLFFLSIPISHQIDGFQSIKCYNMHLNSQVVCGSSELPNYMFSGNILKLLSV